jgi:hypothetical protein
VHSTYTLAVCKTGIQDDWGSAVLVTGDANKDNEVDMDDYDIWLYYFTNGLYHKKADFNNDGAVNTTDFSVWLVNFGEQGDGYC